MYYKIMTGLCLLLLCACNRNLDQKQHTDITFNSDTVRVEAHSPILNQIATQSAQYEPYSAEFRTVGTVRAMEGKLAEIAPPFAGRVVKAHVRLGQKVRQGDAMFDLGSSEFHEETKAYFAAESANETAQRNYNRQKELVSNGVASQKELEQAKTDARIAEEEAKQAKANLEIFNIDPQNLSMGEPLRIISPIDGEVVRSNITIGQYVKEDAEPLVVVADLNKVWVVALVKEKYFGAIKPGDRVEVYTDAHPGKVIWGKIFNIGQILDEQTRSLEVIVECDNSGRELKPGMFTGVHFLSAPAEAIVVPSSAILQAEKENFIFVEINPGTYVRRKVTSETVNKTQSRIAEGVSPGEKIVTQGEIYLSGR